MDGPRRKARSVFVRAIVRGYNEVQPELVIALNGRKVEACRSHDEMSASPSG